MKLVFQLASFLSCVSAVNAVHQSADIFYHEKEILGASMWHFNSDGVTIYSPSGDVLKAHRKASVCEEYVGWRGTSEDCSFFTMASDGHKYVWAAAHTTHKIDIFDIDTGDYVGYQDTCNTPLDLSYHPGREEMWLRCAQADDDTTGEIDVFSSGSVSSQITVTSLNGTSRPYGRFVLDSSLGNYAYASSYNMNWISQIDLSAKAIKEEFEIPLAYGAYDMTYSPVNEHIFMRVRVCCTCGSVANGTDVESCGYYGGSMVHVQTGPHASPDLQVGVCSSGCEGSAADTIGAIEFDTVSKTFVAEHNINEYVGYGCDPVASPDGEHILLFGNDGGQYVRVLAAGANGEASTFVTDIPVDFSGGTAGRSAVSDFAFVKDDDRNILVLAANCDNDVVLVDMNDGFAMRKINVSPGSEDSTGGSSRKVEWAIDTDYIWVNGGDTSEQYIIKMEGDIYTAELFRTLTDVESGNMIYVNNYERVRAMELMYDAFQDALLEEVDDDDEEEEEGTCGQCVADANMASAQKLAANRRMMSNINSVNPMEMF